MKQIKLLTWNDVYKRITELRVKYSWYERKRAIDIIMGVTTGGIVSAFHLSNLLDTSYYNLRPNQKIPKEFIKSNDSILIIDDILDTGKTKKKIMKQFKGRKHVYFETLFKAKKNEWVIFPYETSQDKTNQRQTKY